MQRRGAEGDQARRTGQDEGAPAVEGEGDRPCHDEADRLLDGPQMMFTRTSGLDGQARELGYREGVVRKPRDRTLLRYDLDPRDAGRRMTAVRAMGELLFAAGAREVLTGIPTAPRARSRILAAALGVAERAVAVG